MPIFGLGTWKSDPEKVEQAVITALEAGYRMIDCAAAYGNEKSVGEAFKKVFSEGKIKREEVFVISKLWNTNHAKEHVEPALRQTLKDLQLDYLDLYLVHFPVSFKHQGIPMKEMIPRDEKGDIEWGGVPMAETWAGMEEVHHKGLAKAIGVCNYHLTGLIDLMASAKVKPAVNQVETHPYLSRQDLVRECKKFGIQVMAYSPLGSSASGDKGPMKDFRIEEIAKYNGKNPGQVILRWLTQRGIIVIPKSENPDRIKGNIQIANFRLSDEEMKKIDELNRNEEMSGISEMWKYPIFE